ncbi:MAG: hypothetical protein ACTS1X_00410 [Parasphingopyxis sp.]|uniref:hypothetical protein n=1 Tax=Parasphingopyxis sp. TaxID=1920299 RepID=UPI003FA082BE
MPICEDTGGGGPHAFILSWERPIYLWACLDSFYRATRSPCRFVLADNASGDPLVQDVIDGFERRGMFEAVHRCPENDPRRFELLIGEYWDEIDEFFVFVEGDTAVVETERCWLETILSHMRADPEIGAIGSRVYQPDFVDIDQARKLRPDMSGEDLAFLVKAGAPMRRYVPVDDPLISPHCPPLRLLVMRKKAFAQIGFDRDAAMHRALKAKGWKSLISTEVVHRHLSLLNIYDYPDYNREHREKFFTLDAG